MARWAVVRVYAEDAGAAQRALVSRFAPVTLVIDTHPPASGAEWEFRVMDRTRVEVVRALESHGIGVLASKTEIGEGLRKRLSRVFG